MVTLTKPIKIVGVMPCRDGCPRQDAFMSMVMALKKVSNDAACAAALAPNHLSIVQNRNEIVHGFLNTESGTHLLMVDDDVVIPEDAVIKLLECEADLASACVPMNWTCGRNNRVVLDVSSDGVTWEPDWFEGIIDCYAVGFGCVLFSRRLLEAMEPPYFELPFTHKPQQKTQELQEIPRMTEDTIFCDRVRKIPGMTIRAHGEIRCSHHTKIDLAHCLNHQSKWFGCTTYDSMMQWPTDESHLPLLDALLKGKEIKSCIMFGGTKLTCERLLQEPRDVVFVGEPHDLNRWPCEMVGREGFRPQILHNHVAPTLARNFDADLYIIDCGDPDLDHDLRHEITNALARQDKGIIMLHDVQTPLLRRTVKYSNFTSKRVFQPKRGPATAIMSNACNLGELFKLDSETKEPTCSPA